MLSARAVDLSNYVVELLGHFPAVHRRRHLHTVALEAWLNKAIAPPTVLTE